MAAYIAIPKLGMTMKEATLVEWKVREGDRVEKGDVILVIETEKTTWEVEAAASGFVHILLPEDVKAPVSRVVGLIAETRKELEALQKEPPREIFTTDVEAPPAPEAPPSPAAPAAAAAAAEGERVKISPVARKMAQDHMIDLSTVTGTGPDGRIVREDIERAIEAAKAAPAAPAAPKAAAGALCEGKMVKSVIPLKGMRRTMAEHMMRSLSVAAQLTDMGEVDMSGAVKLRSELLQEEERTGARITFTDIFVLAIARALRDNPIINASVIENEIVVWDDINVGVAVATEVDGEDRLIVPVVRNADRKSLLQIDQELRALVEKARAGKLMPDEVSGGTFTLTNMGAFGGVLTYSTPIINQPQSGILSTAPITDRPVVRDGQIVVRPIMTYNFTYDHRVVVGAAAGRFTSRFAQLLENPSPLL